MRKTTAWMLSAWAAAVSAEKYWTNDFSSPAGIPDHPIPHMEIPKRVLDSFGDDEFPVFLLTVEEYMSGGLREGEEWDRSWSRRPERDVFGIGPFMLNVKRGSRRGIRNYSLNTPEERRRVEAIRREEAAPLEIEQAQYYSLLIVPREKIVHIGVPEGCYELDENMHSLRDALPRVEQKANYPVYGFARSGARQDA